MGKRHVGRLEQRLRDWVKARLAEREIERGETERLAEALGEKGKWVSDYVRGKRHLSLDKLALLMKHYRLNIHQVIDELPLPPADYETRQMLLAWDRAAQTERGAEARSLAFEMLLKIAKLRGPFQPEETIHLVAPVSPATPVTETGTHRKTRGGDG